MLVRVLGTVELAGSRGESVRLPGNRQPALLAALAARANQVVSTDRLISLLWGDRLPENPEASLHTAVHKLRHNLRVAGGRDALLTRERGYLLVLLAGDLDAAEFSERLRAARDQEPGTAVTSLSEALELWRGPAYQGFADTEIAHLEAMRLEEARRTAIERLGEALLATGRAEEVTPLLEPFVAEHPLREGARASLMRSLHELGRTAEALDHYQHYRRTLAEELGLEPSRAIQALQVELLRHVEVQPAVADRATGPGTVSRHGLHDLQVRYLPGTAGNVVAYGTSGTGPPLLVHLGWVSSLDVIASGRDPRSVLLERLADHFSLTLYDRAGTGLSTGPVPDYGLEASIAELERVARAIGPPVSLFAASGAGPIAVGLAAQHVEWVRSLVLFGTFANAPATFTDKALLHMIVEIARSHWGMGSKMVADLYQPSASDEAAWLLARVFRDSASAEVAAHYLAAMFEQDVSHLLPCVPAPALVLHYRGDRLIPFRGAQDLAAGLPQARLVPLDGKTHLPDVGDLDALENAIVQHLRQHA